MEAEFSIDIQEGSILETDSRLLDIMLKDRTTGRNILWATDDYSSFGDEYGCKCEVVPQLITGKQLNVIQPRVSKMALHQSLRTREKAEVFTPSWVCNEQNNLIDAAWFGHEAPFNLPHEKSWSIKYDRVQFANTKERTWMDYVDARRLEVACGEAPYLISRYDTVTGEPIAFEKRIGLLDRKLRIVNENCSGEVEWMKWTTRAFQSIYGYEFQGDNLLLARENLLYTFIDSMTCQFNHGPDILTLRRLATIISWNVWQMDGLTNTVPFGIPAASYEQTYLFTDPRLIGQDMCKVKDWRSKVIVPFSSMKGGRRVRVH